MGQDALVALVAAKARLRTHDIEGAPFAIGLRVTVVAASDETAKPEFMGRSGVIEHYEYDCGCEQTFPEDPMIGVRFDDGQLEEFWPEELAA